MAGVAGSPNPATPAIPFPVCAPGWGRIWPWGNSRTPIKPLTASSRIPVILHLRRHKCCIWSAWTSACPQICLPSKPRKSKTARGPAIDAGTRSLEVTDLVERRRGPSRRQKLLRRNPAFNLAFIYGPPRPQTHILADKGPSRRPCSHGHPEGVGHSAQHGRVPVALRSADLQIQNYVAPRFRDEKLSTVDDLEAEAAAMHVRAET